MSATPIQAHKWDRAPGEWYSDGPSAADALFKVEKFQHDITDPCCGMGNIVRMAWKHGYESAGYDIEPRGYVRGASAACYISDRPMNFFDQSKYPVGLGDVVSNFPYARGPKLEDGSAGPRVEELAIDRALDLAEGKVAFLGDIKWMVARMAWLRSRGLMRIWVLTPRLSILPGLSIQAGEIPGGGSKDYCWYVFRKGADVEPTIREAARDKSIDAPENWTWRLGE